MSSSSAFNGLICTLCLQDVEIIEFHAMRSCSLISYQIVIMQSHIDTELGTESMFFMHAATYTDSCPESSP